MSKATITATLVRDHPALRPGSRKHRTYDEKVTGFYVELHSTGTSTYGLRYSDARRRRREVTIGHHGDITAEQARRRAAQLKAEVTLGGDPAGDRDRLRGVLTFADFVAERFMPHARDTIRPHAEYEAMVRLRLPPAFGRLRLDEITVASVAAFRRDLIAEGLSAARVNRHLAVLRSSLNLALRWDLFAGRNPAQSPGMLREEPRERFLTEAELRALMLALGQDADRVAASAAALLALTGAREAEVLGAKWEHVDYERRLLTVPVSKSGRRRHVVLPVAALDVLRLQPRAPDRAFVFPSARRPGRPIESVKGVWQPAKAAAGLPADFRLHDLRHNFASLAINGGASLYEVGKLLGHSQLSTTARYAHLSAGRLLDAANAIGRIATGGTGAA